MSKLKIFQFIAIVAFLFIVGCDTVEEPYIESNPYTGVYASDLPIRKILLEDFTGWACVNCPRASDEIHKLQETYGGHVVAIGIHSGFFADPNLGGGPDFRTDVGLELGGNGTSSTGFFDIVEQPMGVINMRNKNGDYRIGDAYWSKEIYDILSVNKFADIDININLDYDDASGELGISINSKLMTDLNSKLKLAVYIIENNIDGKQKDGSDVIDHYSHKHVLRAGVNGTWGDEISTDIPVHEGAIFNNEYTYTLDDEWDSSNCAVIAFIYNSETLEVIQAEETELAEAL